MRTKWFVACVQTMRTTETMQAISSTNPHMVLAILWTRQGALALYINASHVTIVNVLMKTHFCEFTLP